MITYFFIGMYMHQSIIGSLLYNCKMLIKIFHTFKTLTIQVVKISTNCYSKYPYINKFMLTEESIFFHLS